MTVRDGVSIGLVVLGAVMPTMGLWLRLRFRLQRERERRSYLHAVRALPAGTRVQELRDDGTRLTIDIGTTTRDEAR